MHALLVHGAGGGAWEWNLWRGVLAAHGLQVHALQLEPVACVEATMLADYQAQVAQALHALSRPRVLIGASLGGLLALRCASDADALVLINPLPPAPWNTQLPGREWPKLVRWQSDARLASTRNAMPDADDASALFAFRHWRDESGAVLREAYAGVAVEMPDCPLLVIASADDTDVPPEVSEAMAHAWTASLIRSDARGHVGPLLGKTAIGIANQAVAWINALGWDS